MAWWGVRSLTTTRLFFLPSPLFASSSSPRARARALAGDGSYFVGGLTSALFILFFALWFVSETISAEVCAAS